MYKRGISDAERDIELKRQMEAKQARVLAIANAILPVVRDIIAEVSISDHAVVNGKLLIDYERAGSPFRKQVGKSIAASGPKLCKEFFWANTLGVLTAGKMDTQVNHTDKHDALEAVARLKDPGLDAHLDRLKAAARRIITDVESEVAESKRTQLRKELRGLISSSRNKYGFDRDDIIVLFEEELRLIRVEDVTSA